MGKYSKLTRRILASRADGNIQFRAICQLLIRLGFDERVRGDHHVFTRDGVDEIINLQPKGGKAKPYQVRQVRGILIKYQLGELDVD